MIVVDTHVILWDALDPSALSAKAKREITRANETGGMIFCEISLWEIAMLMAKNRLHVDTDYQTFIELLSASNQYIFRGLSPEIAELSTRLPDDINPDPADRIIAATAIVSDLPLVTADKNLRQARSVRTIW